MKSILFCLWNYEKSKKIVTSIKRNKLYKFLINNLLLSNQKFYPRDLYK